MSTEIKKEFLNMIGYDSELEEDINFGKEYGIEEKEIVDKKYDKLDFKFNNLEELEELIGMEDFKKLIVLKRERSLRTYIREETYNQISKFHLYDINDFLSRMVKELEESTKEEYDNVLKRYKDEISRACEAEVKFKDTFGLVDSMLYNVNEMDMTTDIDAINKRSSILMEVYSKVKLAIQSKDDKVKK